MEGSKSVFKYLIFIFVLGLNSFFAKSQSLYGGFETYGCYEGLYHSGINTIMEDSKGFIWVGSSDGLVRTEGVFFDTFSKNNTFSSSLTDNTINCIVEDINKQVIWVGTSIGGINRFDISKKDSINFYIKTDSSNVKGYVRINAICQIDSNKFLVGTQSQGAYFFYPDKNTFIRLGDVYKDENNFPQRIYNINKGDEYIWMCTSVGLLQFDLQGELLHTFYFQGSSFLDKSSGDDKVVIDIIELDHNTVEFISGNALFSFNWKENKLERLFQSGHEIRFSCFQKDDKGYWLGTINHGLIYYNKSNNSTVYYDKHQGENSIPNDIIKDLKICQDNSVLWIATRDGLAKYDYHKSKFLQFDIEKLTDNEVNSVFALAKDSHDNYWFNSLEGFFYKAKENEKFSKVDAVGKKYILKIFEDTSSNLWILSTTGLIKHDIIKDTYDFIDFKCNGYLCKDINFITDYANIEGDHILWLISRVGLIKFDLNTEAYKVFPIAEPEKVNSYRYTSLQFSNDNKNIWIGSRGGELIKFNIDKETYKNIDINALQADTYKPCIILDLAVDSMDNVWIATFGSGMLLFDEASNKVSFDMAEDVLESYVYGIVSDDNGYFWISTNQGILRVNQKDRSRKLYTKRDGTYCSEFNDGSYYKTKDGNILFGGINGFIEFDPDKIYKNTYVPEIHISSYSENNNNTIYGSEILEDVRYDVDSAITVHGDSELTMYASVINYSQCNDNRLKWKLEGYDDDWRDGYAFQTLNYSNLKKGSFVLRVKGINNDGVESKSEATLIINVKSRLIDTTLFQIFLVLLIVAIILTLIRVRALWQKSQKALLIERVNEKTEALTALNQELEESRNKIYNQKTELEIHRNYLEEIVELRTADLEQAKLKAEESDKLKTSFLANLSHEIRTPMNAIIGFSNLLMTGEFEEEQQKHFLNVINQSSESLLALINDIIDISRIETGNIELIRQDTNIPNLIQEVTDELKFEKKSEDVEFMQAYQLSDSDLDIYIDRYRLKQIISNLLRNAFKFTPEGHVKITVKSADKKSLIEAGFSLNGIDESDFNPILFVIEDTGIGIKEKDQKLIFEPFQKAQDKKKLYEGMGLGLSIVRNLVDLFGGDIIVKSAYNEGTVFSFYINKFKNKA